MTGDAVTLIAVVLGVVLALEGWQLRAHHQHARHVAELRTALVGLDGNSGLVYEVGELRTARQDLYNAVGALNAAVHELQQWRQHLNPRGQ